MFDGLLMRADASTVLRLPCVLSKIARGSGAVMTLSGQYVP
jgi:hypothetical protein